MKRIGILGGTFNPIHIGHLAMAEVARDRCGLDQVVFVPCFLPPHKNIRNLVKAADRYNMVRLGLKDNPFFKASDFEINKGGKSYTIDTVRHFQSVVPAQAKLFFIVGGDNLEELPTWRDIKEILKIVTFVVINRPGHKPTGPYVKHLPVRMPGIDVSASYIRHCIQQGHSIRYFVPEPVAQYIEKRRLYKRQRT